MIEAGSADADQNFSRPGDRPHGVDKLQLFRPAVLFENGRSHGMLPRMHGDEDKSNELFEEVERRAYMDLPEDEDDDNVDVFSSIEPVDPGEAKDLTLGGYIALHNRPPAFSGTDDQPYTVDIDVEPTDDPQRPYAAF